jgi:hypothetical protein
VLNDKSNDFKLRSLQFKTRLEIQELLRLQFDRFKLSNCYEIEPRFTKIYYQSRVPNLFLLKLRSFKCANSNKFKWLCLHKLFSKVSEEIKIS